MDSNIISIKKLHFHFRVYQEFNCTSLTQDNIVKLNPITIAGKTTTLNNAFNSLNSFKVQITEHYIHMQKSHFINFYFISGFSYNSSLCTLKLRQLLLSFSRLIKGGIDKLNKIITKSVKRSVNHCNPNELYYNTVP